MKYVVCFSGGMNQRYNEPRYKTDVEFFLSVILSLNGFSAARTTVLHADGGTNLLLPCGMTIQTIAGTKANLINNLQQLSTQLQASDILFFFVTNHGGPGVGGQSTIYCWNEEQISGQELAVAFAPIASTAQVCIFGQCYAGGLIPALNSNSRAILTACDFNVSYAAKDGIHDEFLFRVTQAIANGLPTLQATFASAVANDQEPEHPQLSDPGGIANRADILG